ncbi:vacuolar fusion protein CCZ1 homolog [Neocloeon triangulifer]|uniref:vacuolar fusion protein CCZ1 homolog n=1 Tax=Neocloeon triangulifer TaxID=2078957 RepID=UPI00286F34EB|nr:vacuolar fusion protein CCZ1 homolog [Neocloeon triangulifer]
MSSSSEISLLNFYYFNSIYGPNEGEEEKKVLYYYPSETDIETQIKNVGLSEAIIKFTETFNPSKPCESLHTQKTRQVMHQAEPGFWSVMTLSVPTLVKSKDGQDYTEYQTDDINDAVYLAVLKQCHLMFQLFNGHLSNLASNPSQIKVLLDQFYSRLLPTLKLQHSDLLDIFAGMQFLPLDANTFLHVQCLVNKIEASFPSAQHSAVFFNDQLVWSGIDPLDMQLIFHYLVTSLLPNFLETEIEPNRPRVVGRYVTGPNVTPKDDISNSSIPRLFLTNGQIVYLIVYKAMNATICLLLDSYSVPTPEFFRRLDGFLSSRLSQISEELAASCSKSATQSPAGATLLNNLGPDSPKFIYYNTLNRATKSTIHLDGRKCGLVSVSQELIKLLADVHSDKEKLKSCSEIILKTRNDSWVAGKFANLREFYVVLNTKNANLIEISDEVKRLCDLHLRCIFFTD